MSSKPGQKEKDALAVVKELAGKAAPKKKIDDNDVENTATMMVFLQQVLQDPKRRISPEDCTIVREKPLAEDIPRVSRVSSASRVSRAKGEGAGGTGTTGTTGDAATTGTAGTKTKKEPARKETKERILHVLIFGAGRSPTGAKEQKTDIYSPNRLPSQENVQKFIKAVKSSIGATCLIHFLESGKVLSEDKEELENLAQFSEVSVEYGAGEEIDEERRALIAWWVNKHKSNIENNGHALCVINAGYWLDINREMTSTIIGSTLGLDAKNKKYTLYPYFLYKSEIDLFDILYFDSKPLFFDKSNFEFNFEKVDIFNPKPVAKYVEEIRKWNPKDVIFFFFFFLQIFYAIFENKEGLEPMREPLIRNYVEMVKKLRGEEKYVEIISQIASNYLSAYIKIFYTGGQKGSNAFERFFYIGSVIVKQFTVWPEGEEPLLPYE